MTTAFVLVEERPCSVVDDSVNVYDIKLWYLPNPIDDRKQSGTREARASGEQRDELGEHVIGGDEWPSAGNELAVVDRHRIALWIVAQEGI